MTETTCDICEEHCEHPERIGCAKAGMLPDTTILQLVETFKILGDATRLKILCVLAQQEMCVCDIAETLAMGQSAISHQLRVLRSARLVKYRREGKAAWYSLDDDHVVDLMKRGLEHVSHT